MPDDNPRFPAIRIALLEQEGKPVAMVAMVRRALQKAGETTAAHEWTEAAFGCTQEEIVPLARSYVRVE